MVQFKAAPILEAAKAGTTDLETALKVLSAADPALLFAWFWPIMIGTFLAASLLLVDKRDASLLVAGAACIGQIAFVLAPT